MDTLEQTVKRIKAMGDVLVPYNFPRNDPALEDDLNALKLTKTTVDGYDIALYYSKADHGQFTLETVQVYAENHPFLPFNVVIKIARRFLGSIKLSLIEFMRADKKVYCWTSYKDLNGIPIDPPIEDFKHLQFEGFEYNYLSPASVNFY